MKRKSVLGVFFIVAIAAGLAYIDRASAQTGETENGGNGASLETISAPTATVLSAWGFESVTTTNTGTTPALTAGSATADSGALTTGSAFTGLHASSSAVWSNPAGNGSSKSLSSNNWAVGDYLQFQFSTTGYSAVSLTWDQTGSSTGPRDFKVQYSTNGTTFTDATGTNSTYSVLLNGSPNVAWTSASSNSAFTLTLDLTSVTALNNQATVYVRLVNTTTTSTGGGTVAATGTERVDNFSASGTIAGPAHVQHVVDFDGDGKTDYAVYRNNGGQVRWHWGLNGQGMDCEMDWGIPSDIVVPADYDGDGKADIAVWRPGAPDVAAFYIFKSSTSTLQVEQFGITGDDPTVVGDYDGDGKADVAVYRSGPQSYFYYRGSSNNPSRAITYVPWGTAGDTPAPGDYDGDGKMDFVVRRGGGPQGIFFRNMTTAGMDVQWFGLPTDSIVPGDYDGDGKADIAVLRNDGTSYTWYYLPSSGGSLVFSQFGSAGDVVAQGDYFGDGKTDMAVWRPGNPGNFWIRNPNTGATSVFAYGIASDGVVAAFNKH